MRPVRVADNLTTFMCRLSRNLGASTSWNPVGLSRPVMGLLYSVCSNHRYHNNRLNIVPVSLIVAIFTMHLHMRCLFKTNTVSSILWRTPTYFGQAEPSLLATCKIQSTNYLTSHKKLLSRPNAVCSGAQIQGTRSPRRLHFACWRLTGVAP
jgi:hypothetical protein